MLSHGEVILQDDDEIIFRQIRFNYLSAEGAIDSPVFQPRSEDEGKLSVHRASRVTAKEAADQFAEYHDEPSVGYARVKVRDIHSVGLRVIDDFGTGSVPKGHAYIDFRIFNKSQAKKRAQQLKKIVQQDGRNIVAFGKSFEQDYQSQGVQDPLPFQCD